MRLTQKAQVTLFGACVASLIFAGTGYAQAKSVEAKYEEQSKQIELYKDELNDMQGQNIQSTKQCTSVLQLKRINYKKKLKSFLNEKL